MKRPHSFIELNKMLLYDFLSTKRPQTTTRKIRENSSCQKANKLFLMKKLHQSYFSRNKTFQDKEIFEDESVVRKISELRSYSYFLVRDFNSKQLLFPQVC